MTGPVLVTGADGLIGTELLRLPALEAMNVVATGRSGPSRAGYQRCDLSVPGEAAALIAAVRPGTIVHLAGGTSPDRHEVYRKNVLPTVHVLEAAAQLAERPYCIVAGSAAEYGEGSAEPLTELAPLRPVSDYGKAKLAQTTLAESIGKAAGLPLTILRPFNLVSSRLPASTALGNLRQQLLRGADRGGVDAVDIVDIECGRLDIVRDFVPLSAVAETIRQLTVRPAPGQTINVCTGIGIELGAILQALAVKLGASARIVQKPELLAIPAAPSVVGDPTLLTQLTGIRITTSAEELAGILLEPGPDGRP